MKGTSARLSAIPALWAMLILAVGYTQAQTPGQIAKFDAGGNLVDSVITEDATGNIGIATTSPNAKTEIVVLNEGDLALRLDSGPNAFLDIRPFNIGGRFQTVLDTVNNRDVILLPGSGNFGIGTILPNAKAEIAVVNEGDLALRLLSGPNAFLDIRPTNGGGRFQTVLDTVNSRDIVFLPGLGSFGIGTMSPNPAYKLDVVGPVLANRFDISSDQRLKEDVTPLTGVLGKLAKVRGVSFKWNARAQSLGRLPGHREIGVIAQDVEAVFPELVTTGDGKDHYKAVDYSRLTAIVIEAVKELKQENEALRRRIDILESVAFADVEDP